MVAGKVRYAIVISLRVFIWLGVNSTWHRPNSFYQILYACMGISQAIFTLLVLVSSKVSGSILIMFTYSGIAMNEMAYFVSQNLHNDAIRNIFYAPMSFFDTTVRLTITTFWRNNLIALGSYQPAGRILSVFGKDIDSTMSVSSSFA